MPYVLICLLCEIAIMAWAGNSVVPLVPPSDSQQRLLGRLQTESQGVESTVLQYKSPVRSVSDPMADIWDLEDIFFLFSILGDSCTLTYFHVKSKKFCSPSSLDLESWLPGFTVSRFLTIAANPSHAFNYVPLTTAVTGRYKIKWYFIRVERGLLWNGERSESIQGAWTLSFHSYSLLSWQNWTSIG